MGPKAPKKDASKKATTAKAGGKEPAKPDLSKKVGDGDKKNDKKDDKKEPKKDDSDKKLKKEEKADDKKDKADAKKGKEQKGTAQITAKVVAKAQSTLPDVASDASKVKKVELTPVVKPAAVKSAHDKAATTPKPDEKKVSNVTKPVAKKEQKQSNSTNDTKKAITVVVVNKNNTAQLDVQGPAPGIRNAAPIQVKAVAKAPPSNNSNSS